jgi:acyl-CoA thioester hydrolase
MAQRFSHRLRVRYGECDQQGVVFNAHYFAYFDVVLTEVWREAAGGYEEMMEQGTDMVVAEAKARFLKPARFDDEIDLQWWITRLGNTAVTSRIDVLSQGELLVEGEMRHVFIDLATKHKKPIPGGIRRGLEAYVEEAAAAAEEARA